MTEQEQKYNKIQSNVQRLIDISATDFFNLVKKAEGSTAKIAMIKAGRKIFTDAVVNAMIWGMTEVNKLANIDDNITVRMMNRYRIGNMTLSKSLYINSQQVQANAIKVIRDHTKYFHDVRKLTLELYEGYGFKDAASEVLQVRNPRLPAYMSDAVLTRDVNSLLYDVASKQASELKTPMLRATYLKILDDIKNGRGEVVLQRSIKSAIEEKSRYYASRIATTELHRTRITQLARQYVADSNVQYVQIELSASHPKTDMCDIFASQNRFGMGPGVYPTDKCPAPPFHPHCMCSLTPRWDLYGNTSDKENKKSATVLLRETNHYQAQQMAGTAAGLRAIKKGMDYHALYNSRVLYPEYKLKTLLDKASE